MDKRCLNCNEIIDFNTFNNCWNCGSDKEGNKPSVKEFNSQKIKKKKNNKGGFFGITMLVILIIVIIKIKESISLNKVELNQSEIKNSSQNNNESLENSETNQTYFEGSENSEYTEENDGKIYESNSCSTCNGSGIEPNRSSFSDEVGRICPMCDGKGVRSY